MFSTLRSRSSETTLHVVENNSRGLRKFGMPQRLACSTCRQKKLRCSGEKPTCQRCQNLGVRCAYAQGRGGSRSGSSATSRLNDEEEFDNALASSSSKTSSGSVQVCGDTVTRDTLPFSQTSVNTSSKQRNRGWSSTTTPSPHFEVIAAATNNGSGNACVNPIEAMSPLEPLLWTDLTFDGTDTGTGTGTGTGHIGAFDMDQYLISPAMSNAQDFDTSSNQDLFYVNPAADVANVTAPTAHRPSTQASTSRQDSIMSIPGDCGGSPTARGSLQIAPSNSAQCSHDCLSSALRSLEIVHQFPAHGAISPRDLLKHIGIYDRHCIKTISQIFKCSLCTRGRQFLLLLVTILDNCVDTLGRIEQTLTVETLLVADSTLTGYGVDSVEDFIRMYSPILMPIRGELERMVEDLLLRFDQEASRPHQLLSRMEDRLRMMLDFNL